MAANPLQILKDVETKFDVERIAVSGLKLWPFLRVYFGQQISTQTDASKKAEIGLLGSMLSNMFYGFWSLWGKYDTLILAPSNLRKIASGQYVDRVDLIAEYSGKTLILELPVPNHRPRTKVGVKHIASRYFIHFLEYLYEKLLLPKQDIEGLDIVEKIESHHNTSINPTYKVRRFLSQLAVMKYFMKKWSPKRMFVIAPYNNCAYMKVAHDMDIEVIELQHGVINDAHYGYNVFKEIDQDYYPDQLWTYGENELSVFQDSNHYISNSKVKALGSYHLDLVLQSDDLGPELLKVRSKAKKLVAVSSQESVAQEMIDFISKAARLARDVSFVFIPRYPELFERPESFSSNIIVLKDENIYTIIKAADIHATAYSTTALEAPALGVPNILINIKGFAEQYYGELLSDPSFTAYADNPESFVEALETKWIGCEEIRTRASALFRPNFIQNIELELSSLTKS